MLLTDYRDGRARRKVMESKGIYKRWHKSFSRNDFDHQKRYEIEWIGREGLAPETHEEYLNDFINHFYKNVLRWFTMLLKGLTQIAVQTCGPSYEA